MCFTHDVFSPKLTQLSLVLLSAFVSQQALAQDAATQEDAVTPEVTLATQTVAVAADASKTGLMPAYAGGQVASGSRLGILGNKSIMQTPFSTSGYTNDYIQNKQASTAGEILKHDPSVRVARGFGNFQESYIIRGFVTDSDDTMFNGLYGIMPRQRIAAPLFERVEVLRGASAFLNGAAPAGGSVGGSINLVPKRAPNTDLNNFTLGYGAGARGEVDMDVARRFGPDNAFGARINLSYGDGDTPINHEKATLGVGALGLDYRGDALRVSADLGWQNNKLKQTRTNVASTAVVPDTPDAEHNWAQPWSYSNERDAFGTLRAEYDINPNITAYGAYGFRYSNEANSLANLTVNNLNGAGATYRFDNTRKDEVNTGELGARGKWATDKVSHDWVVSGSVFSLVKKNAYVMDYTNTKTTNLYRPIDYGLPAYSAKALKGGDLSDPQKTADTFLSSVALGDTIGLFNEKLQLTLGLRYQTIQTKSFDYNTHLQAGNTYKKSRITPVIGVLYRINDQVSVYGNYVESLKQGETAAQTTAGHVVPNANAQMAPYVSKQGEVGIKYDNGVMGAGLALFTTKQPRAYYDPSNQYRFGVNGSNQSSGAELTFFGSPTAATRLLGGMTYIKASQKDTGNLALDGKDMIGIPRVQGNIGLEWDVPKIAGLTLTGDVAYTAGSYLNAANTLKTKGYATLDLGARYTKKLGDSTLVVRGEVKNITNKNYWVVGNSSGGYLVLGDPRSIKLTASLNF